MNPAARAAFALGLKDFSDSLPETLIRRFARCVEKGAGGPLKVKLARQAALKCSVEILKLAGGQDGLIVAEVAAQEESHTASETPSLPQKIAKRPKKPPRQAPAPSAKILSIPALTPGEMRAFKAIGRKVRKLCKEKRRSDTEAAPARRAPAPPWAGAALSPEGTAQALKDILSAFDLVLFLSGGLDIMRIEGRAQRLGWRKTSLRGRPLSDLLIPYEHELFQRMLKKLRGTVAQTSKDTLAVAGETGDSVPCRAVLGRWDGDGTAFFLALLSLELPARLKRQHTVHVAAPARLAA